MIVLRLHDIITTAYIMTANAEKRLAKGCFSYHNKKYYILQLQDDKINNYLQSYEVAFNCDQPKNNLWNVMIHFQFNLYQK